MRVIKITRINPTKTTEDMLCNKYVKVQQWINLVNILEWTKEMAVEGGEAMKQASKNLTGGRRDQK